MAARTATPHQPPPTQHLQLRPHAQGKQQQQQVVEAEAEAETEAEAEADVVSRAAVYEAWRSGAHALRAHQLRAETERHCTFRPDIGTARCAALRGAALWAVGCADDVLLALLCISPSLSVVVCGVWCVVCGVWCGAGTARQVLANSSNRALQLRAGAGAGTATATADGGAGAGVGAVVALAATGGGGGAESSAERVQRLSVDDARHITARKQQLTQGMSCAAALLC